MPAFGRREAQVNVGQSQLVPLSYLRYCPNHKAAIHDAPGAIGHTAVIYHCTERKQPNCHVLLSQSPSTPVGIYVHGTPELHKVGCMPPCHAPPLIVIPFSLLRTCQTCIRLQQRSLDYGKKSLCCTFDGNQDSARMDGHETCLPLSAGSRLLWHACRPRGVNTRSFQSQILRTKREECGTQLRVGKKLPFCTAPSSRKDRIHCI
mmetsp:Transcript_16413/g.26914  ORF Transcript_16413/g.26914 Transcript_16413/m.26914 type:complete len:205 (+) Transcript_16413:652-1266(+)